jgi:hypothetical protein
MNRLRLRKFYPGVTDAVQRAITDVETNVADAILASDKKYKPAWNVVTTNGNYQAQLWDFVVCMASGTILIPESVLENAGSEIALAKVGAMMLLIRPLAGTIDGVAFISGPITDTAAVYISSGNGWHSFA